MNNIVLLKHRDYAVVKLKKIISKYFLSFEKMISKLMNRIKSVLEKESRLMYSSKKKIKERVDELEKWNQESIYKLLQKNFLIFFNLDWKKICIYHKHVRNWDKTVKQI
ncbi:hypothetical protein RFI_39089 [Reticulomyxa filosa]|uniref:Uncharacterized protein n=1 Tax=Reticulomyxa filosa TaxID=46433 RepID=X6LBC4_RETFI|nr:hypothetical protein RFI_39089 [Reticulomyxa filosa]|eukprot:ETN98411.1 hypothetical protein RFI_39089 [Reticulomyxa filosa]